uniref:Uncharacterized protein n=1 Tax=Rhizophora mucronata TaxID=61149 RepID=A0A2P2QQA4_RHIMU
MLIMILCFVLQQSFVAGVYYWMQSSSYQV